MLQTSCMSLYEDMTQRSFFFWMTIGQLFDYIGQIRPLVDQIYSAEKKNENILGGHVSA